MVQVKANNAAVSVKWLKLVVGTYVELQYTDLRRYVVGTSCTTNTLGTLVFPPLKAADV